MCTDVGGRWSAVIYALVISKRHVIASLGLSLGAGRLTGHIQVKPALMRAFSLGKRYTRPSESWGSKSSRPAATELESVPHRIYLKGDSPT